MFSGTFYALLAGFLGAAASLSAKLSLGADYLREMCESGLSLGRTGPSACDWLHIPLRLLCGGLLFICNAVMWTFFSKALRLCSSSARATVTTTASNFISSVRFLHSPLSVLFCTTLWHILLYMLVFCVQGLLGRLIFGESHAALWWMGISLTLCGLLVLHGSTPQTLSQEDKKDK
uniref:Transmembrane protein 42a n=1 Tax=Amphiprion percula TaxID=161767 RepID=A0A3P8S857_AMPPE